jgi:hypothetical protein
MSKSEQKRFIESKFKCQWNSIIFQYYRRGSAYLIQKLDLFILSEKITFVYKTQQLITMECTAIHQVMDPGQV